MRSAGASASSKYTYIVLATHRLRHRTQKAIALEIANARKTSFEIERAHVFKVKRSIRAPFDGPTDSKTSEKRPSGALQKRRSEEVPAKLNEPFMGNSQKKTHCCLQFDFAGRDGRKFIHFLITYLYNGRSSPFVTILLIQSVWRGKRDGRTQSMYPSTRKLLLQTHRQQHLRHHRRHSYSIPQRAFRMLY